MAAATVDNDRRDLCEERLVMDSGGMLLCAVVVAVAAVVVVMPVLIAGVLSIVMCVGMNVP